MIIIVIVSFGESKNMHFSVNLLRSRPMPFNFLVLGPDLWHLVPNIVLVFDLSERFFKFVDPR